MANKKEEDKWKQEVMEKLKLCIDEGHELRFDRILKYEYRVVCGPVDRIEITRRCTRCNYESTTEATTAERLAIAVLKLSMIKR